jgi:hypothetical protein
MVEEIKARVHGAIWLAIELAKCALVELDRRGERPRRLAAESGEKSELASNHRRPAMSRAPQN